MEKNAGVYKLLHMLFAGAMDSAPERNTRKSMSQMRVLTTPTFRSTVIKKEKNNHVFFLKHPGFQHERERFSSKTDGFSPGHPHFQKKIDKNGHEHVQKFFKTVGYTPGTFEKIRKTIEKSLKTLCDSSETLRNFSMTPGILSETL